MDESKKTGDGLTKKETRRRARKVKRTHRIFRLIDKFYDRPQNKCPYVKRKDIAAISCERDVVYDAALPDVCRLDIYSMPSEQKRPAIIIMHGGGYTAGDKKYRRGQARFFALNGFTVFNVNYGLCPEYLFPKPFAHLVAAVNFVRDNADRYNVDAERIIYAGDSAGAYYAAALAAAGGNAEYGRAIGAELDFVPLGVLLNCGLYSEQPILDGKMIFGLDDGVFLSYAGRYKSEFDGYELRDVFMPYEHINEKFPPAFIIYSPRDVFCKGQGPMLINKLDGLGVYNEYYEARQKKSNHCFCLTWRSRDAVAANELMLSFAKRLASGNIK